LLIVQGDTGYSDIDRADVAEACVASLFFPETKFATFELFQVLSRVYVLQLSYLNSVYFFELMSAEFLFFNGHQREAKPLNRNLEASMFAISGQHTSNSAFDVNSVVTRYLSAIPHTPPPTHPRPLPATFSAYAIYEQHTSNAAFEVVTVVIRSLPPPPSRQRRPNI
jgi:hypothetical protein